MLEKLDYVLALLQRRSFKLRKTFTEARTEEILRKISAVEDEICKIQQEMRIWAYEAE